AAVTGRAKRLKILESERQLGMRSNGLDMIDLEAPARAALNAPEAVAALGLQTQGRPARGADDASAIRGESIPHHSDSAGLAFRTGRPAMRAPSATASTLAAAASMRPSERALASFALFAGSLRQTASANAERSNSEGRAFTRPSKHARLN